jgi:hypothetical protein
MSKKGMSGRSTEYVVRLLDALIMNAIGFIFKLAVFLLFASILLPIIFSLIGMLLPFIGLAIIVFVVIALLAK